LILYILSKILKIFNNLSRTKKEELLWEKSTSDLKIQVWDTNDRRSLRFGNHIIQSVFLKNRHHHLFLPYTRFMMLALIFCPTPKSVLHIGLGGGSIARWMHLEFPEIFQTVIEINREVIEAAKIYFDLPNDSRMRLICGDATEIIPNFKDKFDLIILDAFSDYGTPDEINQIEFLKKLKDCLNNKSWLVGNFWTITGDFEKRRDQWKSTFSVILQAKANDKGNVILYGSQISEIPENFEII